MKSEWIHEALGRFEKRLIAYAYRLVGDVDRARDIVQEVFLKLWKIEPPPAPEHLAAWLFTVCRNQAIDVLRKEKKMRPASEFETANLEEDREDPNERMERVDAESVVSRLLAGLPKNQREVIRLKFQEDLSYKEISQVTGLSVSNVGYLIHMGVQSIKRELAEKVAVVEGVQDDSLR